MSWFRVPARALFLANLARRCWLDGRRDAPSGDDQGERPAKRRFARFTLGILLLLVAGLFLIAGPSESGRALSRGGGGEAGNP